MRSTPSATCPTVGSPAPAFTLAGGNLADVTLGDFAGKGLVINIFPSIDTGVCQASVREFNEKAGGRDDVTVLNVSADLPFAQSRFCGAEGIEGVTNASSFRSDFGETYGVRMAKDRSTGCCHGRSSWSTGTASCRYIEQVPEIGQEPNYDAALGALG